MLEAYKTDRDALCLRAPRVERALERFGETFSNIERLRSADSVAVVTGQQTGLFTGPLYTLYKALSAVKLAACLTARGTDAVPVFWMATEDHDWEEVQTAEVIACDGRLASVSVPGRLHREGEQVGGVTLDASVEEAIEASVRADAFERVPARPRSASCATPTRRAAPSARRSRGCSRR